MRTGQADQLIKYSEMNQLSLKKKEAQQLYINSPMVYIPYKSI